MHYSIDWGKSLRAASVAVPTIVALALLGMTASYWAWQWFAPRQEARAPVQMDAGGQISAALALFGSIENAGDIPASTGTAIRLLGVVAAREGRAAYAIVIMDEKQIVATRMGEEIGPGIKLAGVEPDHIVLERNGVQESLAWPEKAAPHENAAQRATR